MSDVKFVIGIKNSEPAPPEFQYYCGPKPPIGKLSACVSEAETIWDENPDCAEVFRSIEGVAEGLDHLSRLCGADGLFVKQRIVSYNLLDTDVFMQIIQQNRINRILKTLDEDDIKYLEDNGVLDLTIVT